MPLPSGEWVKKAKPRVNYALLTSDNRYVNLVVSILGRVNAGNIDPSGHKCMIETSDRQQIMIRFRQPLDKPLTNYVEFICLVGKGGGRDLECLDCIPIKNEITEDYDFDTYNRALEITEKFSVPTGGGGGYDNDGYY